MPVEFISTHTPHPHCSLTLFSLIVDDDLFGNGSGSGG